MRFFVFAFAVLAAASAASIASDYLPPQVDVSLPSQEYIPPAPKAEETAIETAPEEKTDLAEDGYRYKTQRRLKLRQRRDVSELPSNEYIPPSATEHKQESQIIVVPEENTIIALATDEIHTSGEKSDLADDGYRYKTVRRLKYRQRRDVSELPLKTYLPPTTESKEAVPLQAYLPPVVISTEEIVLPEVVVASVPEETTVLANDGYRYKTVRRLRFRKRRDASELPLKTYLPPVAEHKEEAPLKTYLPPSQLVKEEVIVPEIEIPVVEVAPEEKTVLADDGYRYKTVRRIRYRNRRDVNELPLKTYLPPSEEVKEVVVLKTYLPPVEATKEEIVVPEIEIPVVEAVPEEKTELAADGYRYKTVRRIRYRHRRDVSELPVSSYLPPAEDVKEEAAPNLDIPADAETAPEEKTDLAADGYRYKAVRRLKYRQRRDVSELLNTYLPPAEESKEEIVVESVPQIEIPADAEAVPEEKTVLADDGYRYKTVRRLKYRQRRDVNELLSSKYLPPTSTESDHEEIAIDITPEFIIAPESALILSQSAEDNTVLADDGYRYKTVRRLKYRHRRDVNELPALSTYLPPSAEIKDEEIVQEVAPESTEPIEEEKTALAEDGYRYKTVRRLKYRQRRDVSELPSVTYLPAAVEPKEIVVAEPTPEIDIPIVADATPAEETVLAKDGYRYKTVRRLRYRQRRDVNELPANEYLPPVTQTTEEVVVESIPEPVVEEVVPEEKTIVAADGYRYKTVRRLKYRQRRDVNELPTVEYLPPSSEHKEETEDESIPEEKTVLADDGYRYKAVRRLKYRH